APTWTANYSKPRMQLACSERRPAQAEHARCTAIRIVAFLSSCNAENRAGCFPARGRRVSSPLESMVPRPPLRTKLMEWLCLALEVATLAVWIRVTLLVVPPVEQGANSIQRGRAAYRRRLCAE